MDVDLENAGETVLVTEAVPEGEFA